MLRKGISNRFLSMIHGEYLTGNPLIGRKAWLVRHIVGDKFGDPWDWSVVVVKRHFFSRTAVVKGAMNLNSYAAHLSLQLHLSEMGFLWAKAHRRNGIVKSYRLPGSRFSQYSGAAKAISSESH